MILYSLISKSLWVWSDWCLSHVLRKKKLTISHFLIVKYFPRLWCWCATYAFFNLIFDKNSHLYEDDKSRILIPYFPVAAFMLLSVAGVHYFDVDCWEEVAENKVFIIDFCVHMLYILIKSKFFLLSVKKKFLSSNLRGSWFVIMTM